MFRGSSLFDVVLKLTRNCETRLVVPKCSVLIDLKHDHILCPERVVVNFITVRRAKVWCLL